MAVFSACMKSCLVCTTSFTAVLSLPLVPACVSYQCEEYWTLRTGIIWKACQLAISMNSSEPEVIDVPAYARTALIGEAFRLPASLSVCWWLVRFIPAPIFHAVLKFPALSIGYLLLHELCSVWTREYVVKHTNCVFWQASFIALRLKVPEKVYLETVSLSGGGGAEQQICLNTRKP
jgi:hypothetical protein